MPELRLTLLVVGLVFLVALAWWELRRPHQVRGSDLPRPAPDPLERPAERTADWDLPPSAFNRGRSPELELPRMSARDPEEELPVLEVGAAEFAAFEAGAPEARFIDTRFGGDSADEVAVKPPVEAPEVSEVAAPPGPAAMAPETAEVDGLLAQLGPSLSADPPISDIEVASGPDGHGPQPDCAAATAPVAAAAAPEPGPPGVPEAPAASVIVEWPAADASQVIAVRVISVGEKFSGRAVRLALAAEGFVLGRFSIFHKPAADGRALLSVAGLTKPGTFDLDAIDMQRFSGLNLFAVLPGPVPGPQAVDELLACAQVLAQRLRAVLQDEQGAPLSPSRTAAMRDLAAAAP
jgi:cell division protein ZipA